MRKEKEELQRKSYKEKMVNFFKKIKKEKKDVEEEKKIQLPKEKLQQLRKVMLLGLIIIVAVIFLSYGLLQSDYNSFDVIEETDVKNVSIVDYIPYQKSLLKYSKDGAVYVDEKDKDIWNETFAMKMPVADVCGEYAAIADLNGNDVYIFNQAGKVSNTTMPYKICDVAVAGQGEFAVILEGEKENYINIYDKNGEQISEIQTTIDKSGYPVDIDLSEDGEKLFSTYLYLDGVTAKNGLAAYNFGAVGQNENADRLMGGYQLEDTIVPKVEFLDNNTICAFGDNQFIIYSMKEKSSERARITFDQEIKSVVYNASYVGAVVPNQEKDKQGGNAAPYVLELYNTNGRKIMTKKIDFEYDDVRMNEEEIVFTGGNECRIYTIKGKQKFSYTFKKNVIDMVPTGAGRRYIVIYESGSEVIRLKHESDKE